MFLPSGALLKYFLDTVGQGCLPDPEAKELVQIVCFIISELVMVEADGVKVSGKKT